MMNSVFFCLEFACLLGILIFSGGFELVSLRTSVIFKALLQWPLCSVWLGPLKQIQIKTPRKEIPDAMSFSPAEELAKECLIQ